MLQSQVENQQLQQQMGKRLAEKEEEAEELKYAGGTNNG